MPTFLPTYLPTYLPYQLKMALITRSVGEPPWATDGLLRLLRPLLVTAPKYLKIPRKLNSIQGKVEVSQGTNECSHIRDIQNLCLQYSYSLQYMSCSMMFHFNDISRFLPALFYVPSSSVKIVAKILISR